MSDENNNEEKSYLEKRLESFMEKVDQAVMTALVAMVATAVAGFTAALPWTIVAAIIAALLVVSVVLIWRARSVRRKHKRVIKEIMNPPMPETLEINDEIYTSLLKKVTKKFKREDDLGDVGTLNEADRQKSTAVIAASDFVRRTIGSSVMVYGAIYASQSQSAESNVTIDANIEAKKVLEILFLMESCRDSSLFSAERSVLIKQIDSLNRESTSYLLEMCGRAHSVDLEQLIKSYRLHRKKASEATPFSSMIEDFKPLFVALTKEEKIDPERANQVARSAYLQLDLAMKSYHVISSTALQSILNELYERADNVSWKDHLLSPFSDQCYLQSYQGNITLDELRVLFELSHNEKSHQSSSSLVEGIQSMFSNYGDEEKEKFIKDNLVHIRKLIDLRPDLSNMGDKQEEAALGAGHLMPGMANRAGLPHQGEKGASDSAPTHASSPDKR